MVSIEGQATAVGRQFGLGPGTEHTQQVGRAEAASSPPEGRAVYVLHSGLNDWDDSAARTIRDGLIVRHIPAEDIIIVPNTYPQILPSSLQTSDFTSRRFYTQFQEPRVCDSMRSGRFWDECRQILPRLKRSLDEYESLSDENSTFSRQEYGRFCEVLQQHGVTGQDRLVWIGHSAGGQMGLTMAEKAQSDSHRYRFEKIVTLGSAVFENDVDPETRVVSYISPDDAIIGHFTRFGGLFGYEASETPPDLDENDDVHVLPGVEHTAWPGHVDVLDAIVSDRQPRGAIMYQPHPNNGSVADEGLFFALQRVTGFVGSLVSNLRQGFANLMTAWA